MAFSWEQYWGLSLAFGLQLLVAAALMWVLQRMVRMPGPAYWGWGAVLGLAGMAFVSGAMSGRAAWHGALFVLGDVLLLAGIALAVEGMRRFYGGRPRLRWHAALLVVYVACVSAFELEGDSLRHMLATSALAAGLWLGLAVTALRHMRGHLRVVNVVIALCAVAEASGWVLRGAMLMEGASAGLFEVLPSANGLLIAVCFVATGALVLLYVQLVNFRLAEEFRAQAVRDPLTGALNRRGFEQGTARLAALSARLGQPVAMVVLDLDKFKLVNDRHGHQVGDQVLKALSLLVHRAKRETDVFARLGGEEFCLVLPGTDIPGARVFTDRLRRSFETLEIDTGRSFLSCTVSMGVAYASAAMLLEQRIDLLDLLHQADEALYEAKRAGRNRVRFYASPEVVSSKLDSRLFASTGSPPISGAEHSRPSMLAESLDSQPMSAGRGIASRLS